MSQPKRTPIATPRQRKRPGEALRETTRHQIRYRRGVCVDGTIWVEVDVEPLQDLVRLVVEAAADVRDDFGASLARAVRAALLVSTPTGGAR